MNFTVKKDKTHLRRIEGGPNREDLFDALRLGGTIPYLDEFLWGATYKQRLKNVELLDIGRVYENCNHTWRIKYKLPGHQKPIEAFYSTNTRTGFICKAEEIISVLFPPGIVYMYRPLTDYQIMALLQLASISRHPKLVKHIKARFIRATKEYEHLTEESELIFPKEEIVADLFEGAWEGPKNLSDVAMFREILG
jgi:hypothetical protein